MKVEEFEKMEDESSEENFQYINDLLKKLDTEPVYPIKNRSISASTSDTRPLSIIRLTRPQFTKIAKHAVLIEINNFNWLMAVNHSQRELLFSRMFVTLEYLFGSNDKQGIGDGYKRSFYFPFLLKFPEEKENLGYLMMVHDHRLSIDYKFAKILPPNENLDKNKSYKPFEDFTKEEIKYTVNFFYGYSKAWFENYLVNFYDRSFYKTIASDLGVYGYKEGEFFDESFDDPDIYNDFLSELSAIVTD